MYSGDFVIFHHNAICTSMQKRYVHMPFLVGKLGISQLYLCSLQPSWSRAAAHNALFAKHSIGASLAKTCFEPCVSQSACACNTARYMVTTCIGGNIAPNLTAALGTQVQRHGVALLPHMIVQLLQYTTGLTWQYTQDLQNKEAMSNMHDVLSEA